MNPQVLYNYGGFSFWQAQQRQVTAKRDSVSLRYTWWSKSLYALDLVYWNNPKTIDDLKMAITEHIRTVDRAVLNTVFENTVRRVNKCLETGVGTIWTLIVTFCIVIIRCTETFDHSVVPWLCTRPHVKYPLNLSDYNETWIIGTDFQKQFSNTKFHENSQTQNFMKILNHKISWKFSNTKFH